MWSRALGIFAALLMLVAPVVALAEDSGGRSLLAAMGEACRSLDYQGRFLYSQGGRISTMEVRHAIIDDHRYERLTHLDGKASEWIRRGREVVAVGDDQRAIRMRPGEGAGPLELGERMKNLPGHYNVLIDGDDRVAGRQAVRMRVVPLDEHRFGYRLWIDRESSLLLRSELVNNQGQAMERMEFLSLDLQPGLSPEDFSFPGADSGLHLPERGPRGEDPGGDIRVRAGWLPEGFAAVDDDLRGFPGRDSPVHSQTFSDGIAAFTVFVESLDEQQQVVEGVSRHGPTVAVTRLLSPVEASRSLLTLVGEIPLGTAERVIGGLELTSGAAP